MKTLYSPEFFDADSFDEAKFIVLCSNEQDYNYRWDTETEWIRDQLISTRTINEHSLILDWGTGVGRLSKMLIETFNCTVVGVDISHTMLRHAVSYVNNTEKFIPVHYSEFINSQVKEKFTCCVAAWVLQHSITSAHDIKAIHSSLINGGNLFVLEMNDKCVIGRENGNYISINDGVDNKQELQKLFNPLILGKIPRKITVKSIFDNSWWGFLEKNYEN